MNKSHYEFEANGDWFYVEGDGASAYITDVDGLFLLSIYNNHLWPLDQGCPEALARLALSTFRQGEALGKKEGRWTIQRELRGMLGIQEGE